MNIINIGLQLRDVLYSMKENYPELEWDDNLGGACVIGSAFMVKALQKINLNPIFNWGSFHSQNRHYGHCWVNLNNHIIDVTATQFAELENIKVVYINKHNWLYSKYFSVRKGNHLIDLFNTNPKYSQFAVKKYSKELNNFLNKM
ncbi:MAG: hypothetical protein LC122_02650 [Chitinophagales bacterium]|nr:hypothetical protein [Chitinophagales bacterium]